MTTTRIKAQNFPDLDDTVSIRGCRSRRWRCSRAKGEHRSFEAGEVLYEQGRRDAPFFVIERGRVDFIDHKPGKEIWIAEADAGTFIGDIATFTGEPAIAECVAAEPTETIVFDRQRLRAMLAGTPELGELVLGTACSRAAPGTSRTGTACCSLIAERGSRARLRVRDLLERNLVPLRFHDVDLDPLRRQVSSTGWTSRARRRRCWSGTTRCCATPPPPSSPASSGCARRSTASASTSSCSAAGPAGLAAAVSGGSEGFSTFVAEAWGPGGQAGTSSRIENYLGFPTGISGADLTRAATLQARRFDAVLSSFHRAVELADGPEGLVRVDLDDGQHVLARTVVDGHRRALARARPARRRALPGRRRSTTRRCRPTPSASATRTCSWWAAATRPARRRRTSRGTRAACGWRCAARRSRRTMSRYLVDRIERSPRIEVLTGTEVVALHGRGALDGVTLRDGAGREQRVPVRAVFVMIGAEPCTEAATGVLGTDAAGYLLCGPGAAACDGRLSWPLSRPSAPHARDGAPRRVRRRRRARGRDQPGRGRRRRRSPGDAVRPRGPGRLAHAERNAAQNPKLTSVKYQRLEVSHITARAAKSVPPNTGRAQLGNEWFFSTSSFTARKP